MTVEEDNKNGTVEHFEKKDGSTENVGKEIADPVVVEIKPANGVSKANEAAATNGNAAATNGNAAKPMLAENGGAEKDKADGSEKTETTDENKEANQVGIFSMFRFASILDILLMLVGSIAALIHGVALPLVLAFFGDVVDGFIMTSDSSNTGIGATASSVTMGMVPTINPQAGLEAGLETIVQFSLNYVILGCGVLFVAFLQCGCWNLAAEHQVRVIRTRFFRAVLSQDISWFDEKTGGELTTRISDDINKIRSGTGSKIGLILQCCSTLVAGLTIGFLRSWRLSLVIMAVSLGLIVPVFTVSAILVKNYTQEALDSYAKAGSVAEEVLSSMRTVTAFGGESKELERYRSNLGAAKIVGIKKAAAESVSLGALFFVIYGAYAVAFWYGTILILDPKGTPLSAGGILITFLAVLFGSFSLAQAGPYFADFASARGAAFAIWEVIDQVPVINCLSDKGLKPAELTGRITFEDIQFVYPSRPDTHVLQGFNLEVNVGQTVALVGSSGCGKSTTVALMQRYYDPVSGSVKLDGQDIKDLNVKWLRENIGVVSQEPILFGTTIAENIRYGRLEVSEEQIHQAAKEANAYDFIMELPEKFETLVGERGAQLSGGQKQRVAIARALVRNPKILLLDEATSALDSESEGIVQAALEKVQAGRTTIVIAHRLSTIKNSDKICAIQNGVVVEEGTHAELMDRPDGVYAQLVKQQQTKEVNEAEDEAKEEITDDEEDEEEGEKELTEKESLDKKRSSSFKMKRVDSRASGGKRPSKNLMSQVSVKSEASEHAASSGTPLLNEDNDEEILQYFSWGRIMKMNASEWYLIVIGFIAAAFNGGVQPAFAIIFSRVLRVYGGPTEEIWDGITFFCIFLAVLGVVALLSNSIQGVMYAISGERLTERLRYQMFKAILRMDMSYFDDHANNTGAVSTRLATEASLVQGVTGVRFGLVAEVFFNIVVAIIISFIYSWQLTLLVLAFVPFLGLAGIIEWQLYAGGEDKQRVDLEQAGKVVTEASVNIRTVQSLTRELTFWDKYVQLLHESQTKSYVSAMLQGATFAFSQCIIYFAYAAAFRFGGWLVENGKTDFDDVFLVFSAIIFGAFGLGRAFAIAPDFAKAKMATARMFMLFDTVPSIDKYNNEGLKPDDYVSEVSFQKVRFRYPTRPDVPVLAGLTISVKPGETLALVGSSGCGKSTSVALVERFYDSRSGDVLVGSYDIKILNLQWWRQQIGLVSQEPVLFDRSIADNIAYGDNSRNVSQEEIEAAAKSANIHDFIASLPLGYDTRVGDKGTQLSGGQKQRIAIARALLRNPRILLLDEATSALDTESERVVQAALDEAKKGRTCITIAHRLSTIHDAEKIAVIKHGRVAELGTHEELMALKEQYYSLYTSQSLMK
ncbi:ATP-dependent translocase ABCB1-like isoform X3 [Apostichopus japonicus]|uniref:ATP-dependent translocase ABCB1-like isoform X2 n=1 Tax=Stichopus japonicus TaxID=307972 RepID=UPI003AB4AF42